MDNIDKLYDYINSFFQLPLLDEKITTIISTENLQLIYRKMLMTTSIISLSGMFITLSIMYGITKKNKNEVPERFYYSESEEDSDSEGESIRYSEGESIRYSEGDSEGDSERDSEDSYIKEETSNKRPFMSESNKRSFMDESNKKIKLSKEDLNNAVDLDELNKKSEIQQRFDMLFNPPA